MIKLINIHLNIKLLVNNDSEEQLPHPAIFIRQVYSSNDPKSENNNNKKLYKSKVSPDSPSKVEHDKHDMIVEEGWVHLNI